MVSGPEPPDVSVAAAGEQNQQYRRQQEEERRQFAAAATSHSRTGTDIADTRPRNASSTGQRNAAKTPTQRQTQAKKQLPQSSSSSSGAFGSASTRPSRSTPVSRVRPTRPTPRSTGPVAQQSLAPTREPRRPSARLLAKLRDGETTAGRGGAKRSEFKRPPERAKGQNAHNRSENKTNRSKVVATNRSGTSSAANKKKMEGGTVRPSARLLAKLRDGEAAVGRSESRSDNAGAISKEKQHAVKSPDDADGAFKAKMAKHGPEMVAGDEPAHPSRTSAQGHRTLGPTRPSTSSSAIVPPLSQAAATTAALSQTQTEVTPVGAYQVSGPGAHSSDSDLESSPSIPLDEVTSDPLLTATLVEDDDDNDGGFVFEATKMNDIVMNTKSLKVRIGMLMFALAVIGGIVGVTVAIVMARSNGDDEFDQVEKSGLSTLGAQPENSGMCESEIATLSEALSKIEMLEIQVVNQQIKLQKILRSYECNVEDAMKLGNGVCDGGAYAGCNLDLGDCELDGEVSEDVLINNAEIIVRLKPSGHNDTCIGTIGSYSGEALSLVTCDNDEEQSWYYDENDLLRLEADRGKCAARSSTTEGNLVRLAPCDTSNDFQKWTAGALGDANPENFELNSTNQCMQFDSVNIGQEMRAYNCDGGVDQKWDVSMLNSSSTDLFSGSVSVLFRFEIRTSRDVTDILVNGLQVKEDIEAGLDLLVPEVIAEEFGNTVSYSSSSIVDTFALNRPSSHGHAHEIEAEIVLEVTGITLSTVERQLRDALSEAVITGRLEDKITYVSPDSAPQDDEWGDLKALSGSISDSLSAGAIAGIVVGTLAGILLVGCLVRKLRAGKTQTKEKKKKRNFLRRIRRLCIATLAFDATAIVCCALFLARGPFGALLYCIPMLPSQFLSLVLLSSLVIKRSPDALTRIGHFCFAIHAGAFGFGLVITVLSGLEDDLDLEEALLRALLIAFGICCIALQAFGLAFSLLIVRSIKKSPTSVSPNLS